MQLGTSNRSHCGICGFSEIHTDEVVDRNLVFLAECPRCKHRWTSTRPLGLQSAGSPSVAPRRVRVSQEVAPAA